MLTVGVALFATFSGFLANLFPLAAHSTQQDAPPPGRSDNPPLAANA